LGFRGAEEAREGVSKLRISLQGTPVQGGCAEKPGVRGSRADKRKKAVAAPNRGLPSSLRSGSGPVGGRHQRSLTSKKGGRRSSYSFIIGSLSTAEGGSGGGSVIGAQSSPSFDETFFKSGGGLEKADGSFGESSHRKFFLERSGGGGNILHEGLGGWRA